MPQIITPSHRLEDNEKEKTMVFDTIRTSVHDALAGHGTTFLNTLWNMMKEVFHGV
jgi:hypothetical protein